MLGILACISAGGITNALAQTSDKIDGVVYESEFQRLWKQHGKEWAAEDKDIEKKLEALRKKHGKSKHKKKHWKRDGHPGQGYGPASPW